MIPPPIAIGLTICEKVIVEERTRNVSLIGTFTKMNVRNPATPPGFAVYAVLTDGFGEATITLRVAPVDTDEEIYTREMHLTFPDRLAAVGVLFHVNECSFPAFGRYTFTLLVDGEWVAQQLVRVVQREASS